MIRQLAFDLPARPALGRDDLFVAPSNALALASLEGWRAWPGGKMVLVGPRGAGKTHLAHVWAAEANAVLVDSGAMPGADLEALTREDAVVLEDADRLAGEREAEEALFHLHNLMAAARKPFLLTASAPPRDWGLMVPDVLSRMMAASVARIESPDDAMLSAVLVKLFADRQIAVPPPLVPYLVARMDRSIGAARALVAALDSRSLQEHRPITRQLAAEVLEYDSVTNGLLQ
ncbi:DnaA ATPase domain-containing protein [Falsirhodobacter xinxiangensis]|uniref:DnaA ATPase domain-containing protein n=1 Tax=Falsirhodobacter xinxiangensis TaxID=2530049 RepID=UPI0010AAB724|nr:DnaA/Hda family protein [Rhodobacter xinxiangensis]